MMYTLSLFRDVFVFAGVPGETDPDGMHRIDKFGGGGECGQRGREDVDEVIACTSSTCRSRMMGSHHLRMV